MVTNGASRNRHWERKNFTPREEGAVGSRSSAARPAALLGVSLFLTLAVNGCIRLFG